MLQRRALPQTVATGKVSVSDHGRHGPLPRICRALCPRCDPRGSRQGLKELQPLVADNPLARAACGWARPLTAVLKLHVV